MTNKLDNKRLFVKLREQFPVFVYDSYSIDIDKQRLSFDFNFVLSDEIRFNPSYSLILRGNDSTANLSENFLNNLVFNIGLIEMISYWKATCSPEVMVKAGGLSKKQIRFFENVIYKGMGEFRFLNGLDVLQDEFVNLNTNNKNVFSPESLKLDEKYLVPVGGGKDSVVSVELLKRSHKNIVPFALNPDPAITKTVLNAGFDKNMLLTLKRSLDPAILELNRKGFLNGHTPFSALLAFNTLMVASVSGCRWITLSNESSANEPTVPGTDINHQYSKSLDFENAFRTYYKEFICSDMEYVSLLRPLNELQISALFSEYDWHFDSFRSCNVGSKNNSWCGACPKCLFVFVMLSPFLSSQKLKSIFNKDLLDDVHLKPIFDELTGISEIKPFECVGTVDEVNAALCKLLSGKTTGKLPVLLEYYKERQPQNNHCEKVFYESLEKLSSEHNLNNDLFLILKNNLENSF